MPSHRIFAISIQIAEYRIELKVGSKLLQKMAYFIEGKGPGMWGMIGA